MAGFALWVRVVFWICALVHVCMSVTAFALLQLRRKVEPVRSRSPLVLSTLTVPTGLVGLGICMSRALSENPCKLTYLQDFAYQSLIIVMILIRVGFTFIKFRIVHESFMLIQGKNNEEQPLLGPQDDDDLRMQEKSTKAKQLVWSKSRRWLKGKRLVIVAWSTLFVLMIPAFVFMATLKKNLSNCTDNFVYNAILYFYRAVIVLGGCWGVWHLRKEKLDYFWLYNELKYNFIAGCLTFFLFSIFISSPLASFNSNVFPLSSLVAVLFYTSFLVLSMLYPCYLSFKEKQFNATTLRLNTKTLQDVLSVKRGEELFVDFLRREFALENWLFKQRVDSFKKSSLMLLSANTKEDLTRIRNSLKSQAEGIFKDFILEDSVHQVNISGPHQNAVKDAIKQWDSLDNGGILCLFV
eukprot:TRINITY_DN1919_c0_g2_i2.p1 TRINITY_DN1919_c0_g2~~TRINITY_DN1919_c0_g2_i2.p1  ORF type:complete len:410 (-),score=78.27 TRINITY_DN1919_c0_g2_i2:58-1287(-)